MDRNDKITTLTEAQELLNEALAMIEPLARADANKMAYIYEHLSEMINGGGNPYNQSIASWIEELYGKADEDEVEAFEDTPIGTENAE